MRHPAIISLIEALCDQCAAAIWATKRMEPFALEIPKLTAELWPAFSYNLSDLQANLSEEPKICYQMPQLVKKLYKCKVIF